MDSLASAHSSGSSSALVHTNSNTTANSLFGNINQIPHYMVQSPFDQQPSHGAGVGMASSSSTAAAYVMPMIAPQSRPRLPSEPGWPKVTRTLGQRPSCLVNASVTYCGNNQIYAFGGFDQFTDEVYNHVMRLDLTTYQWSLVDNYGDIPGVRMGHTATLYQNDKLLVFGGENDMRTHLSDLIVFDLKTAHWTQPAVTGPIPVGRSRHAAVLHDDKLFIIGGMTGQEGWVLDEICFLDLKTFCWSPSWRFVKRFDHSAHVWADKIWVFGGMSADMNKNGDLWWLDLKGVPAFESPPQHGLVHHPHYLSTHPHAHDPYHPHGHGHHAHHRNPLAGRMHGSPRQYNHTSLSSALLLSSSPPGHVGPASLAAAAAAHQPRTSNSSTVSSTAVQRSGYTPTVPGLVSSLKFVSGLKIPAQGMGSHFHAYAAGTLLDLVTPTQTAGSRDCALSAFNLTSLRWQHLADGHEIFKPGYRWLYCTMNEDSTKAWLLGCSTGLAEPAHFVPEDYLSDIMEIDLRKYGFLGAASSPALQADPHPSYHHGSADRPSRGLGGDLVRLFNRPPDEGSGTDFIITALPEERDDDEDDDDDESMGGTGITTDANVSASGTGSGGSVLACGSGSGSATHRPSAAGDPTWLAADTPTSAPIHAHRFILQSRWPHFARLYNSHMREFHTNRMHIPEPYTVVRAFLYYLYTDALPTADDNPAPLSVPTITPSSSSASSFASAASAVAAVPPAEVTDVAGLLVLSNMYGLPHLRHLCVGLLARDLDVEHACVIWYHAGLAGEDWLRRRAAGFCMTHWGRVVRTLGFLALPRTALVHLSQEADTEGRVVRADHPALAHALDNPPRYHPDDPADAARARKAARAADATAAATAHVDSDDDEDGMEA